MANFVLRWLPLGGSLLLMRLPQTQLIASEQCGITMHCNAMHLFGLHYDALHLFGLHCTAYNISSHYIAVCSLLPQRSSPPFGLYHIELHTGERHSPPLIRFPTLLWQYVHCNAMNPTNNRVPLTMLYISELHVLTFN